MSDVTTKPWSRFPRVTVLLALGVVCACVMAGADPGRATRADLKAAAGADPERVTRANYKQALRFSTTFLRPFVYDASVRPNWIGKTDCFWYSFRTSKGVTYWRVDPARKTKLLLFDH